MMKNTVFTFREQKAKGEKISMLTAYDYSTAKLMDDIFVPIALSIISVLPYFHFFLIKKTAVHIVPVYIFQCTGTFLLFSQVLQIGFNIFSVQTIFVHINCSFIFSLQYIP